MRQRHGRPSPGSVVRPPLQPSFPGSPPSRPPASGELRCFLPRVSDRHRRSGAAGSALLAAAGRGFGVVGSPSRLPGAPPLRWRLDPGDPPRSCGSLPTPRVLSEHAETPRTSPGRQLLGSNGSRKKPDFFFFFFLEIGFAVFPSL
ncbi:unnamed protein product, partial [Gulo gulo]